MSFLEVPPTQSTAPVFEYRCLFTSDLRRKQKRWQDGQLKFHTFNNRVMVYDDRANFIGDTHWREDELNEGEELVLERRGIMVEVGECTGQKNQDISELVDKPRKEKEDRAAARAAASPASREFGTPAASDCSRPKPLSSMLTPSGHYGRAVISNVSPFDEKHKLDKQAESSERPSKRRKAEDTSSKSGYAQNLMGASLNLSSSMPSSSAMRYAPLKLKTAPIRKPQATIDLTSDSDGDASASLGSTTLKQVACPRDPTAKVQKKHRRSPIAKSGYASSLTGAALSFTTQPAQAMGRRTTSLITRKRSPSTMAIDDPFSSMVEDVSMVDSPIVSRRAPLTMSKNLTIEAAKSTDLQDIFNSLSSSPALDEDITRRSPAKPVRPIESTKDSKHDNKVFSSSPPAVSAPRKSPPRADTSRSFIQSGMHNSSTNEPSSTKATSSLRIKSRAPRKMMMMMDNPGAAKASSSKKATSRSKSTPQSAVTEPVLSQATLRLGAFREQQEARVQARLDGNRRVRSLSVDLSPPDSGIDHRKIDLLLSRKPHQQVVENREQNMLPPKNPVSAEQTSQDDLNITSGEDDVLKATKLPQKVSTGQALIDVNVTEPSDTAVAISRQNRSPIKPAMATVMSPISTEVFNEISNDTQFPFNTTNSRVPSLSKMLVSPTKQSTSKSLRPASTRTNENIPEDSSPALPVRLHENDTRIANTTQSKNSQSKAMAKEGHDRAIPNGNIKTKELAPNLASDIQSARGHFRARRIAAEPQQEDIVHPATPSGGSDGLEAAAVESVPPIKSSPDLASVQLDLPEGTTAVQVDDALPTPKSLEPTIVPPVIGVATQNGGRIPQISAARPLKAKVVNPATRGRSLQAIAASTVDALALDFNAMPPPPAPRPLPPVNGSNSREDAVVGRADTPPALRREKSRDGPWSREAFDLFGDWKPPQNTAGNNTLAGVAV